MTLTGFMTSPSEKEVSEGRNPQTGEEIKIPAAKWVNSKQAIS